jgi:peptidyl-prolyl cis-trans isomerase SDCCAG10
MVSYFTGMGDNAFHPPLLARIEIVIRSIVPGFLVQTGDRTGTGGGGESFYGGLVLFHRLLFHMLTPFPTEPFEDEIHPRLRFPHRGMVAMANNGTKNSNDSQFFITLGMLTVY